MGSYVPATEDQKQKMLEAMGLSSTDELFSHIPSQVRLQGKLRIPEGLSEMEVLRKMEDYAGENRIFRHIFREMCIRDRYPALLSVTAGKALSESPMPIPWKT